MHGIFLIHVPRLKLMASPQLYLLIVICLSLISWRDYFWHQHNRHYKPVDISRATWIRTFRFYEYLLCFVDLQASSIGAVLSRQWEDALQTKVMGVERWRDFIGSCVTVPRDLNWQFFFEHCHDVIDVSTAIHELNCLFIPCIKKDCVYYRVIILYLVLYSVSLYKLGDRHELGWVVHTQVIWAYYKQIDVYRLYHQVVRE